MKKKLPFILCGLSVVVCYCLFFIQKKRTSSFQSQYESLKSEKVSGAGISMDNWAFERAYPNDYIQVSSFTKAFEEIRAKEKLKNRKIPGEWQSLGPQNIAGRTLALAFHPNDPDIIFAGSASGGLWKTTTQGVGVHAWEFVPTGFPVLGVSAIAIDKNDPNFIFIGTGETYGTGIAEPGTTNRRTRGTYGIGILKSVDGGDSWSHSLVFNNNEIKGIQDVVINPQNSLEIFAATSDGVYRSQNAGDTWALVFNQPDCIDIEIDPNNVSIIYVSQGNFNINLDPSLSGIFKSVNGGDSFEELLDPGLLAAWSGNAKLVIDPSNSNNLYASIQVGWSNTGPTTPAGIYKSNNAGTNWTKINDQNIAMFQGWYSHDIAINPNNVNEIINVGIDVWKSVDSGNNFTIKSNWQAWPNGQIDINVPQGGPTFVHADVHAVYYHPLIADKLFFATDGGVFSSEDNGETFVTHNGDLQTGQFYPNMGSSATNPDFIIAGAQDNNSYIYRGDPSWYKIIGGDGMSASVHQEDDQIVFGSFQFIGGIQKSTNGGNSFSGTAPVLVANDYSAFLAPYELAPSHQDVMYAGATYLYKSIDSASNWNATSSQSVDGSNVIVNIAISPVNPDVLLVATSPDPLGNFGTIPKVLKSVNGGQSFTVLTGLPNRVCKDIEFEPGNPNVIYSVFSGFGSNHVYKSVNGGDDWNVSDAGLPDVPTNTIVIDPMNPNDVYVGNDLGVYYSEDGGDSWEIFSDALPEATMIYDLNVSPANRKIRIATHGHGIWQRNFVNDQLAIAEFEEDIAFKMFPNPTSAAVNIKWNKDWDISQFDIELFSVLGQKISTLNNNVRTGSDEIIWNVAEFTSKGTYFVKFTSGEKSIIKTLIIQ